MCNYRLLLEYQSCSKTQIIAQILDRRQVFNREHAYIRKLLVYRSMCLHVCNHRFQGLSLHRLSIKFHTYCLGPSLQLEGVNVKGFYLFLNQYHLELVRVQLLIYACKKHTYTAVCLQRLYRYNTWARCRILFSLNWVQYLNSHFYASLI